MNHVADARRYASALVDREEYRVRSRMLAYENVGQMIGTSGMWLRRFINDYTPKVVPSFPVGMNIIALYRQVCTRVEQEAADANKRSAFIEEATHALRARTLGQMEGLPPRETGNGSLAKSLDKRG